jgi:hypothetical protein
MSFFFFFFTLFIICSLKKKEETFLNIFICNRMVSKLSIKLKKQNTKKIKREGAHKKINTVP